MDEAVPTSAALIGGTVFSSVVVATAMGQKIFQLWRSVLTQYAPGEAAASRLPQAFDRTRLHVSQLQHEVFVCTSKLAPLAELRRQLRQPLERDAKLALWTSVLDHALTLWIVAPYLHALVRTTAAVRSASAVLAHHWSLVRERGKVKGVAGMLADILAQHSSSAFDDPSFTDYLSSELPTLLQEKIVPFLLCVAHEVSKTVLASKQFALTSSVSAADVRNTLQQARARFEERVVWSRLLDDPLQSSRRHSSQSFGDEFVELGRANSPSGAARRSPSEASSATAVSTQQDSVFRAVVLRDRSFAALVLNDADKLAADLYSSLDGLVEAAQSYSAKTKSRW